VGGVIQVGGDETGLAAGRGDGLDDRLAAGRIASVHDDFGAVSGELLCHCLADAGGGSGDQGAQAPRGLAVCSWRSFQSMSAFVSRPLEGEAPTINVAVGYSKSNTSPILKLSRLDELTGPNQNH
jgi:hypothetical protein